MHDAFAVIPVVEQLPLRVESILAHGDRLLVGTDTGVLLVYSVKELPCNIASLNLPTATDGDGPSNTLTDSDGQPSVDTQGQYTQSLKGQVTLELVECKKGFARRAVEQLEVIKEAGLLVVLSDACVHLFDLVTYQPSTTLPNTRGASVLSVHTGIELNSDDSKEISDAMGAGLDPTKTNRSDDSPGNSDLPPATGIPTLVSKVAVGIRRRIVVFIWRDAEFAETREFTAPDRVKSMGWATNDLLCVGLGRGEYQLLKVSTGTWRELLPTDATSMVSTSGASVFSTATSGMGNIGRWGSMGFNMLSSMTLGSGGSDGHPGGGGPGSDALIVKLPNDEILVNRDHHSICLDVQSSRQPMRKGEIIWSVGPQAIGFAYPYVIAAGDKQVEVRSLVTQTLVQQLAIQESALRITQGKLVYVAAHHTIWRLLPLPYPIQVVQLLQHHEYVEALNFVDQSDAILVETKHDYSQCIKLLYAHYLFWTKDYDQSLTLFQDLNVVPMEVLHLFMQDVDTWLMEHQPGTSQSRPTSPSSESDEKGQQSKPPSPSPSSETSPKKDQRSETQSPSTTPPESRTSQEDTASKSPSPTPSEPHLNEELFLSRMSLLVGYLAEQRRLISQAVSRKQTHLTFQHRQPLAPEKAASTSLDSYLVRYLGFVLGDTPVSIPPLAQLIDTTLLKTYLITNPRLVGPLVRVANNACEIETSEKLLLQFQLYQDLVDLYFGKALHRKALQLLTRLATQNNVASSTEGLSLPAGSDRLTGPQATIQYLQRLPFQHLDLILEYSQWVMQRDPELAIEVFIDENRPPMSYLKSPVDRIAQTLQKFGNEWAIQYLEFIRTYVLLPLANTLKSEPNTDTSHSTVDSPTYSFDRGTRSSPFPPLLMFSQPEKGGDSKPTSSRQRVTTMSSPQSGSEVERLVPQVFRTVDHRLASLYLEQVLEEFTDQDVEVRGSPLRPQSLSPVRRKLLDLLRDSTYYTPELLLSRLPMGSLFQERVYVLARMHRHEQALRIIVFQLGDFGQAEGYCRDHPTDNLYLALLKIYLDQPDGVHGAVTTKTSPSEKSLDTPGTKPKTTTTTHTKEETSTLQPQYVEQALHLMSVYGRHMDPLEILELIPAAMPMEKLSTFFEQSLQTFQHQHQTQKVVRNLMVAERLQVQSRWLQLRRQRVCITSDRTCPICFKRIGSTVFVCDPRRQPLTNAESGANIQGSDIGGFYPEMGYPSTTLGLLEMEGRSGEPTVVHFSCHQRQNSSHRR
ncbi:Vacuolar morphogenesis protein 6 [Dispira parvispora]|uniref:Vacuolar morphogenesis protein 6 n=1 Tax=Dispira parvispora TaxID=1520584 RepID=A0A9W8E9F8_9FUNG|nr:Vacuolar morphogenesis protein 6 [Dispira parvispora]